MWFVNYNNITGKKSSPRGPWVEIISVTLLVLSLAWHPPSAGSRFAKQSFDSWQTINFWSVYWLLKAFIFCIFQNALEDSCSLIQGALFGSFIITNTTQLNFPWNKQKSKRKLFIYNKSKLWWITCGRNHQNPFGVQNSSSFCFTSLYIVTTNSSNRRSYIIFLQFDWIQYFSGNIALTSWITLLVAE